jgi:hypothetical protein
MPTNVIKILASEPSGGSLAASSAAAVADLNAQVTAALSAAYPRAVTLMQQCTTVTGKDDGSVVQVTIYQALQYVNTP